MDKKFLRAYLCITIILIFGAFVCGVLYYDADRFISPEGEVFKSDYSSNPYEVFFEKYFPTTETLSKISHAKKLIGGTCALLLLGYLFLICYKKYKMDSKADSVVLANALHKIALESGRTEYELFAIAAEEWSITETQIDKDFKNYMGANVLPYYVMDLVRKNKDNINKSLEKEEKIKPTSWWDLVKALLIFPGSLLIPFFLLIIFQPYFVRY